MRDLGLPMPDSVALTQVGAAAGIAAAVIALAWLAGHWAGPPIAAYWERKAGARAEGIIPRVCALVRYLIIWPALVIALRAYPWPTPAAFVLGLCAAAAAAMAVRNVARGLNLSRWIAWALALFLFVAILADAMGGLAKITGPLDSVAFSVGARRLSLLALIQILVTLLALYAAVKLANRLIAQSLKHAGGLDSTQRLLTQKLAAIAIIAVAFFVAIDLAGIDLTALAVFSGALGLAVGFGLQKTFGNLIAGIILLMDRSIKPGDVISVGESFGQVNKIGVRAVSIVTRDGKEYLIPNELLMTQEVVNWSYSTRDVRISIPIGVAYDCDVRLAQQLMIEAADASPRVLATPKPAVWMTAFGESAIQHEIRIWILDPEAGIGAVRSDILNRVWELFRAHGIKIPFPQRDVHVKDWPQGGPPASAEAPPIP
ncbi:MAG TPA: mechanosensitive ion channel domain-containing protein [Allosphingosinicella sp.]|nr:mechanosensitive ion channel domain-containing protein [Allosphingosinicella sp.]